MILHCAMLDQRFCPKCQTHKTQTDFGRDRKRSDGYSCWCRECKRAEGRLAYRKNPDRAKQNSKKHRQSIRKAMNDFVNSVRAKYGCAICKEKEVCALDFHHLSSRKDFGGHAVTHAMTRGIGALIKEINKCIVLCASCHRKVHANLIQVNEQMLCNEPVIYRPRIFLPAQKLRRCRISQQEDGTWLVRFLKPHSILDRALILSTDVEKAKFAALSRRKIAPSNWNGNPEDLPSNWKEETLKMIRRCPEFYYEQAHSI